MAECGPHQDKPQASARRTDCGRGLSSGGQHLDL